MKPNQVSYTKNQCHYRICLMGTWKVKEEKLLFRKKVYFYPQKNSIDSPVFGAAAVLWFYFCPQSFLSLFEFDWIQELEKLKWKVEKDLWRLIKT